MRNAFSQLYSDVGEATTDTDTDTVTDTDAADAVHEEESSSSSPGSGSPIKGSKSRCGLDKTDLQMISELSARNSESHHKISNEVREFKIALFYFKVSLLYL